MARPASDIRQRLLRAARKAFLKRGVDGSSLRGIASAARTNLGMIYYYFGSKDDLFLAVVEEVYEKMLRDFEVALAEDLPPATRLRQLYERIGRLSNVEVQTVRLVLEEALRSPRRMVRVLERFERGHLPLVFAMVQDGIADGTFDEKLHPRLLVASLISVGAVPQMLLRALGGRFGVSADTLPSPLSETLVGIALGGVGSPATRGTLDRDRSER